MMNYQSTPRSSRPRGFMVRNVLQFALFVAFSLWLLYQIRQQNNDGSSSVSQLSTERVPKLLGRKGSAGIEKSTPIDHAGLTLDDVTNPGEDGEIPHYTKEIKEVEFHLRSGSLDGNDNSTLTKTNDDGLLPMTKKSNISFPDENGIPQHVREKFVGIEVGNRTHVGIRSVVATGGGVGSNGTVEES